MPELLKPKDVAETLGITPGQVHVLLKDNSLRGVRISQRVTRIYADSVSELLKKRATHANS